MKTRTVKVSEAEGIVLDYLVAKCEGHDPVILTPEEQKARWVKHVDENKREKELQNWEHYIAPSVKPKLCVIGFEGYKTSPSFTIAPMPVHVGPAQFCYSANWLQAGPIIEREGIRWNKCGEAFYAWTPDHPHYDPLHEPMTDMEGVRWRGFDYGRTLLIATMRCYVASKLGDEVEVPEILQ